MITFEASQYQGFILALSDREIYNDIWAECDLNEILNIRPDTTPEFFEKLSHMEIVDEPLDPWEVRQVTYYAPNEYINIAWLTIEESGGTPEMLLGWTQEDCEALGGDWYHPWGNPAYPPICMLPSSLVRLRVKIIHRTERYVTVEIENRCDYRARVHYTIGYLALTPEKRYIKLRSINEVSERKYGRRTMDKPWPLGIHPTTMQSLIDNDCAKYSEPVCMASVTMKGKDDDMIDKILHLELEDKHEFVHPRLEMTEQFFINHLDKHHDINGALEGVFDLEQVRDIERTTFFIIGSSLIGGDDVIAP